ncbi:Lactam utilization protein LamB [hydrothermal vent metagenome]|uniref:Lactam utilization protein LamB n=1 Tax=hydrothermal vent metagenome TaxID=652676 RepID=A0A3B0S5T6_9ZZZZ
MKRYIDLNADLGEDETPEGIARDLAMMDIISSCNIACGGHAGSPENMRLILKAAKASGVSAGAHPSYPDRKNFGRVSINIAPDDLEKSLRQQLDIITAAARALGSALTHLKPHGALYNDAQDDEELSGLLINLAAKYRLKLVGMDHSTLQKMTDTRGVEFISEAFIDRRYLSNGRLTPRSFNGAVIASEKDRLEQGVSLAQGKEILDNSGTGIFISAQTLCLHSDSEGALETAAAMKAALKNCGYEIKAPTT